jgi:hypothetical protein
MELDLSNHRWLLVTFVSILLLLAIGWLGHAYSPAGKVLLTRTEWQVLQASLVYRKQLSQLQAGAESLAALLNERPDPVRAQLTSERIQRLASQGQPALQYSREKLAGAAQSVSDWAVGAIEREAARQALEEAFQALFAGEPSPSMPLPMETPGSPGWRR